MSALSALGRLPSELFLQILAGLEMRDLARLAITSRGFHCATRPTLHARIAQIPEALHWASLKGNVSLVRVLLQDAGIVAAGGLSAVDHTDRTPLTHACLAGHAAVATLLLQHGADPNTTHLQHELGLRTRGPPLSLLFLTATAGDTAVVRALTEGGADLDCSAGPHTPLLGACRNGHADTVEVLLQAGAAANPPAGRPPPPLYAAVTHRHLAVAELLLKYGADIDGRTPTGHTALSTAVFAGDDEAALWLLARHARLDANSDGRNLFAFAVRAGKARVVAAMLNSPAALALAAGAKTPPLCLAAAQGHADVVRLLLQHGAAPTARNRDGRSAVLCAALAGHAEAVAVLVAAGADLAEGERRDGVAVSPLVLAAEAGCAAAIDVLIDNGVSVDADGAGAAAIATAAKGEQWAVIIALQQRGVVTRDDEKILLQMRRSEIEKAARAEAKRKESERKETERLKAEKKEAKKKETEKKEIEKKERELVAPSATKRMVRSLTRRRTKIT